MVFRNFFSKKTPKSSEKPCILACKDSSAKTPLIPHEKNAYPGRKFDSIFFFKKLTSGFEVILAELSLRSPKNGILQKFSCVSKIFWHKIMIFDALDNQTLGTCGQNNEKPTWKPLTPDENRGLCQNFLLTRGFRGGFWPHVPSVWLSRASKIMILCQKIFETHENFCKMPFLEIFWLFEDISAKTPPIPHEKNLYPGRKSGTLSKKQVSRGFRGGFWRNYPCVLNAYIRYGYSSQKSDLE